MPRANRYYQLGHVYHITHRCHNEQFFLKHRNEKRHYRYWLYQAVKRYGLSVLNYIVTSNHIHLLAYDTGDSVIANSMRLVASRVAQKNTIGESHVVVLFGRGDILLVQLTI